MRIGLMCLAGFGGSARIATELAAALAQRGHRVHLFARTAPFDDQRYARQVSLHTVAPEREDDLHPAALHTHWSAEHTQQFLARILEVATTEGLDILHFHYAVPFAFLAMEVKAALGRAAPALVGTLHGTDVSIYGRTPGLASRLAQALQRLDKVTTVSRSHARLAAELFGLPAWPEVIPNFVDLSRFHPLPAWPTPATGGRGPALPRQPRIAHLSNFRPVKDTPTMARIFLDIRRQLAAELWLIGEGPEMGAVQSILQGSGYEQDLRYWGLHQDVAPLLAQADLLLMTSLSESFCLAALEALACGVPVLATRVGGLPEVVTHGQSGLLFPVGQPALAARMAVELLSNPAWHQAMRARAVRDAARFGQEQIVPRYEQLYRRLLAGQSRPVAWTPAGAG